MGYYNKYSGLLLPDVTKISQSYLSSMTTQLDVVRKTAVYNYARDMIGSGLFNRIDGSYIFSLKQSQQSLINFKNPSESLTTFGTPVFTADSGWRANNGANRLQTSANLNTYTKFRRNNAHFACYYELSVAGNAAIIGTDYNNNGIYPYTSGSGAGAYSRLNAATLTGPVTPQLSGVLIGSRTAAAVNYTQVNSTQLAGTVSTTIDPPASPLCFCQVPNNSANNNTTLRYASFGEGLNPTEGLNYATIIGNLIAALNSAP